ncbi:mitochondrial trans-2-enoyl-CoA reductase [Ketogulonicigenium robustum]|uniref:Mitochondrial trans-2-enoyl-CoA reductase n=1 Tax=Ketogulonicigenium robustum TaxID=92947 RepID=A0A1W6NWD7_9RHOB|nr:zinc-binding dehydrogenase [Ketogulonicigenium robustum]ARO13519.1 mitochondrial trans-2-enoyl-CoA reductase [Ketogulonicigenium robustum]
MKCAIHATFGAPVDVMTLGDSPLPEPAAGQVRIKTILSPIHNHDLWTVRGNYGYKPTLPAIGGTEAVGLVDALGEGVSGVSVGQRVAVASVHGTWAEYFIAPAAGLIPVPEAIPDEVAAQLIAMPFSAISLLEQLNVNAGDWIIQNTANGAVGKALAMLATARGVNVINLVRRADAIDELAALGIGNAISTDAEGWKDAVRALVGDASLRAAVDSVGGTASGDLMNLLGVGGTLFVFGTMTNGPMQISTGDVIFKQATVRGFWGAVVSAEMAPEKRRELFTELLRAVATGGVVLPVGGIFGLEGMTDAMRAAEAAGKTGKILLRP